MSAIALALAAGTFWGVGDFLGGLSSRRLSALAVLAVSEVAGLLAIGIVVAVQAESVPPARALAAATAAGLVGVTGLGALYRGMAVGAMGVVAPISSAAAAIPVIVGLARGERPSAPQLVGVGAVLVGVALASREPGAATRIAAGVGLALVAAVGFGLYFVFIDVASGDGASWAVLVSRSVATVAAIVIAVGRRALSLRAADLLVLAPIGLFDVSANVLLAVALTKGYVSLVSVLASLYPLVTIALARAVLAERVGSIQAVGIAAALTGVALISAG